ncbi:uncharacterized protein LOC132382214 isoform X12 [Hypanus sabinus]|uniref:uncharacterized protein LOC132382214 isoform X12 n=1 Tax=Hypanus sabinus TaxID=79690 RepID=UPI0028C416E3|nr:uncharacterized protein LOC132382214 isoform X12 [Hypanus sabinus]
MQEEDRSRRFSEAIRDCCLFCPHRDGRGEWQRLVGPVSGARGFDMSHTILLVQPTKRPEGRTYADYESVNECMEDIEQILRHTNPTTRTGSRRKSMSCCGDKPSNQESQLEMENKLLIWIKELMALWPNLQMILRKNQGKRGP